MADSTPVCRPGFLGLGCLFRAVLGATKGVVSFSIAGWVLVWKTEDFSVPASVAGGGWSMALAGAVVCGSDRDLRAERTGAGDW